jgi:hypothetical protein
LGISFEPDLLQILLLPTHPTASCPSRSYPSASYPSASLQEHYFVTLKHCSHADNGSSQPLAAPARFQLHRCSLCSISSRDTPHCKH